MNFAFNPELAGVPKLGAKKDFVKSLGPGAAPPTSNRTTGETVRVDVDLDEKEIRTGLVGNEEEQFESICKARDRYAEPLAAFILEKVAPTIDPHDLTTAIDNVFLELGKKARDGKFTYAGSLVSLLFRMARCNVIDAVRKSQKYYERHKPLRFVSRRDRLAWGEDGEEDIALRVSQRLADAPEVAATWKGLARSQSSADDAATNEVIRQFRMFIPTLPKLQRKVAEIISFYFGDVTNEEICDAIAKTAPRPSVSAVKSARREIREKFKTLLRIQEGRMQS